MPYYVINKQPVFLSTIRYRELKEVALQDKSATWKVASEIAGTEESKESSELMYNALRDQYSENPEQFKAHWVDFDLKGEDAAINAWDLLYDYCHYYGHAFLSDIRDKHDKILASFQGTEYAYPMGKVFALSHIVKPRRWWWRFSHRMSNRTVRIIIDVDQISLLKGNLEKFIVCSEKFMMVCNKDLDICKF